MSFANILAWPAFCIKHIKIHAFFISHTFISNARLKLAKNQVKAKQLPEAEPLLFENYSLSTPTLTSKNKRRCSKNVQKDKYACLNKVIWLIKIKMSMKMKKKQKNKKKHRYDITRPRPRHGYKYTICKMNLSLMMTICIKQHLSNIWSSIY